MQEISRWLNDACSIQVVLSMSSIQDILLRKMLTNALKTLVYEVFLKTFYWKNDKIINVIIFSMKIVLKLFYYILLTITLKASVNMTHSLITRQSNDPTNNVL